MDLPPAAEVATEQAITAESRLEASLVAYVEARCRPERVTVRHLGTQLQPSDTDPLVWTGDPCRPQPVLQLTIGASRRTLLPVLDLWVRGPVAPHDVRPGDVFHVKQGAIPWRDAQANPLVGRVESRATIAAGDPVTPRLARRVPDAGQGAQVTLVLCSGSVLLRAPGVVIQPGFVGDRIGVRNEATRVVQHGVLIDSKTVSLSPQEPACAR